MDVLRLAVSLDRELAFLDAGWQTAEPARRSRHDPERQLSLLLRELSAARDHEHRRGGRRRQPTRISVSSRDVPGLPHESLLLVAKGLSNKRAGPNEELTGNSSISSAAQHGRRRSPVNGGTLERIQRLPELRR
jgi:hypothetical protein